MSDPRDARRISIAAAVVTYGQRSELAAETCRRAIAAGCSSVFLIVNGEAAWSGGLEHLEGDASVTVQYLPANSGSQGGFRAAIDLAVRTDPEFHYLVLLDDDNYLDESVDLREVIGDISQGDSRQCGMIVRDLSVLHRKLLAGTDARLAIPARGSFAGFDLCQFLRRRLSHRRAHRSPEWTFLPYCGYGGLVLSRDAVGALPFSSQPEYVLYEDDTALTFSLTELGYTIELIARAKIIEADGKWNSIRGGLHGVAAPISSGRSFRSYYQIRNRAHFDRHLYRREKVRFALNRLLVLAVWMAVAASQHRLSDFLWALSAVRMGERQRLGVDARYPLP
ncbi:hypothetical protein ACIQLJ_13610 [Microbacterium sp. NPDC091313]